MFCKVGFRKRCEQHAEKLDFFVSLRSFANVTSNDKTIPFLSSMHTLETRCIWIGYGVFRIRSTDLRARQSKRHLSSKIFIIRQQFSLSKICSSYWKLQFIQIKVNEISVKFSFSIFLFSSFIKFKNLSRPHKYKHFILCVC